MRKLRENVLLNLKAPGVILWHSAHAGRGEPLSSYIVHVDECPFFVMNLPCSDAFYVQVFDRECTESFWEGHARAFLYFGAVPGRISYDDSRVVVAQMLGGRKRKLTDGFLQLQSH